MGCQIFINVNGNQVFHKKQKTNIVPYWNYKHFSNEMFIFDVKNSIILMTCKNKDHDFDRFKATLEEAIQRHATMKKRYVRANFMKWNDK